MIYAIDFGLKRIGVARLVNNIAIPLPAIIRKNRNQASLELKNLITESNSLSSQNITLVIGVVEHFGGGDLGDFNEFKDFSDFSEVKNIKNSIDSKNKMPTRIQHFLNLMDFKGRVIFINENLSSKEASEKMFDRKYKRRLRTRKNGMLDSLSACVILERYMESKGV